MLLISWGTGHYRKQQSLTKGLGSGKQAAIFNGDDIIHSYFGDIKTVWGVAQYQFAGEAAP
jgi:hypothetical protein